MKIRKKVVHCFLFKFMQKIFYFFYVFFQGILIFQAILFVLVFRMSKQKEFIWFCLFLLFICINFFISPPSTFGIGEDALVIHTFWYKLINSPIVILGNIFYVIFLIQFYKPFIKNLFLAKLLKFELIVLVGMLILFFILFAFGIFSNLLFNIFYFVLELIGIWMFILIIKIKSPYTKLMAFGFGANIIGTTLSVFMLILKVNGVSNLLVSQFPYFFMKLGILLEILFFNMALFRKWINTEKQLVLQKAEEQLAVEKLRNKLSSELHDDIGSTLSGISMYSSLTKNLMEAGQHEAATQSINVIQKSASEMVDKLGDLVWGINPKQESLKTLIEKLGEFATEICGAKNISFASKITYDLSTIILTDNNRYQLYLLAKEAINNAVKYSNATVLELIIKNDKNNLIVSIKDNGKGFNTQTAKIGNGLINMQKRANELNANLTIISNINL